MLKIKNVTVNRYENGQCKCVLENLNFELKSGQLAVVLGDSGSGKTTLLNLIAGFIRPSTTSFDVKLKSRTEFSGNVLIDEKDVTSFEPKDRSVGLVMQRFTLYPHMTVRQNLEFPLKMLKIERGLREFKISEVAEKLGIKDELSKKVDKISGGQAQRVAIGKLILRNPNVALFDEAFSHLDAPLRKVLRDYVVKEILTKNNCIVFVSHEVKDAKMANLIIVLTKNKNGKGSIQTIFQGETRGEAFEDMRNSQIIEIDEYVNTI